MYEHQNSRDLYLVCKNDATYPPHFHMHCEILYILDGDVTVTIDGETYEAHTNDAIFVAPYQIHSYTSGNNVPVYCLFISPLRLPEHVDKFVPDSPIIHVENPDDILLCRQTLHVLFEAFKEGIRQELPPETPARTLAMQTYAKAFVLMLLDGKKFQKRSTPSNDLVRKIIDYCLENYKTDISLSSMAEALGISEHIVTRAFSANFHCGFRLYINRLRITEAEERLIFGNESITRVAFAVGFSTQRTFNRAFLAEKGMTPSEFRQKYGVVKVDNERRTEPES